MVLLLRQQGNARHEGPGLAEIGEGKISGDGIASLGRPPGGMLLRERGTLFGGKKRYGGVGCQVTLLEQGTRMPAYTTPPAEHDFQIMAERALEAMPERLSRRVRGVAIMIDDIADEETLAGLGIDNPWELTGLYRGIPLTERSVADSGTLPDAIFLYREAILVEWIETGEDLYRLVASVLVHEIAHHFGFSDADIDRIEAEMDPLADGGG